MHIMVTNDDGIQAPGIQALASALRVLGEVTVVAPDRERSAVGHALTLNSPLRVFELRDGFYAVDGTPTDCVNMGIHSLLPFRPDLIVSGINHGANLGDDVTYSGTVAAAIEATLMGIPAIAVSLATQERSGHFPEAAQIAVRVARQVLSNGLPEDTFLNVNVPDCPAEEIRPPLVTRQGKRSFVGNVIDKTDPRGRKYYWIGSGEADFNDYEGTDFHAINRKHVSITPLHLDLTNYASMKVITTWVF
ncbi:5'/3'-nucleotidase SurE [Pelobacter propionicus]|uniref:5'-nucleotidase SurE n=1 Tax=Pelobacter propionicus (strain DSM 2379 / NBRC 103807 / OttBd1) TaxID=338966 RepID=SURE_PELPD|nr:5'/3'-nucleotidase SurE [Pelobacter propionicus]A1ASL7.1 RecName: Full=5'-nucleotidase SurE; AltName: Full=Nucleoside 5'-monophosphate phosphohydrolase [Pelobacter propionicus DSM 2379]ABL00338.1 3'-nucleotidase [Pelobacter propionicus DSM 2379]